MDNVQTCDSYINIPSSLTYGISCIRCNLKMVQNQRFIVIAYYCLVNMAFRPKLS
jgi:hypothetical protein